MMPDPTVIGEIIKQYEKHGWKLRRALVSAGGASAAREVIGDVEIFRSDIDALWFSRQSNPGSEAWELRRLTGSPFALIAILAIDASEEEVEATLSQVVDEMRSKTIA